MLRGRVCVGAPLTSPPPPPSLGGTLNRAALLKALQTQGEALAPADLANCLKTLVGVTDLSEVLPEQVNEMMNIIYIYHRYACIIRSI